MDMENQADSLRYCTCTHTIFVGASCECGDGYLVEACDMNMGGDFTERLAEITTPSLKEYAKKTGENVLDKIWFADEMREPEEPTWDADSGLNDKSAEAKCKEEIQDDPFIAGIMLTNKNRDEGRLSGWTKNTVFRNHAKACMRAMQASPMHQLSSYYPFIDGVRQKA